MKDSSHWYRRDGTACYEVPYADPSKGMRPTTLADARKLNLLPSVTTITKVLAAPALIEWLRREAALAVATTPRKPDEPLDDFVERCLAVDAEATADAAKQLGTDIHDAIEKAMSGQGFRDDLMKYVGPTVEATVPIGRIVAAEKILVGDGYAGKTDCILEDDQFITIVDFKTTRAKKLPAKPYPEHRLQLAGYAGALGNTGTKQIRTANIYISTLVPGQTVTHINQDWQTDLIMFKRVCELWQWQNNYHPQPDNDDVPMP